MGFLKKAIEFFDGTADHYKKNPVFKAIVREVKETEPALLYFCCENWNDSGYNGFARVCLVYKVIGQVYNKYLNLSPSSYDSNYKVFNFNDMNYDSLSYDSASPFSRALLSELPDYTFEKYGASSPRTQYEYFCFVRSDLDLYQTEEDLRLKKYGPLKKW